MESSQEEENLKYEVSEEQDMIIEQAVSLICFKLADLLKVCDAHRVDLDAVGRRNGTNNKHSDWVNDFVSVYESLQSWEMSVIGNPTFSKAFKPLVTLLRTKAQKHQQLSSSKSRLIASKNQQESASP